MDGQKCGLRTLHHSNMKWKKQFPKLSYFRKFPFNLSPKTMQNCNYYSINLVPLRVNFDCNGQLLLSLYDKFTGQYHEFQCNLVCNSITLVLHTNKCRFVIEIKKHICLLSCIQSMLCVLIYCDGMQ